ncbi:MAG: hypothetical protein H7068_09290 [Pedobacter sp.]|nr:hypothetical protein [Chitinophagaceae bacterium]
MKYSFYLLITLVTTIVTSCKNTPNKTVDILNDTIHFFSIKDFFLTELKDVQTKPYFIYQITTKANGNKDSTAFKKEAFASFTQQFIVCDIANNVVKNQYKESAFKDNSTQSITLNYSTLNKELPIQNIDVLLNEETNKVTRIFIRQILENTDSSTTILYSWKANKSCMVTKSVIKKGGTKYTKQQFVKWNDN